MLHNSPSYRIIRFKVGRRSIERSVIINLSEPFESLRANSCKIRNKKLEQLVLGFKKPELKVCSLTRVQLSLIKNFVFVKVHKVLSSNDQ